MKKFGITVVAFIPTFVLSCNEPQSEMNELVEERIVIAFVSSLEGALEECG